MQPVVQLENRAGFENKSVRFFAELSLILNNYQKTQECGQAGLAFIVGYDDIGYMSHTQNTFTKGETMTTKTQLSAQCETLARNATVNRVFKFFTIKELRALLSNVESMTAKLANSTLHREYEIVLIQAHGFEMAEKVAAVYSLSFVNDLSEKNLSHAKFLNQVTCVIDWQKLA